MAHQRVYMDQLAVPVWILAAMNKDQYRKPMTGMWDFLEEKENEGVPIDRSQSFYVGDAAGREAGWKLTMKKDHSCVDRKFAANIGLKFHTPEGFFLNEAEAPFSWGAFNPQEYPRTLPLTDQSSPPIASKEKEVIVFVGYPSSGKSYFAQKYLVPEGYEYVNQDTLKSRDKCVKACKNALAADKSVVIDNTNPEASTRALYIKLAQLASVPVRCFYFTADEHLARHNNLYRAVQPSPTAREVLGDIAFRTFKSKFQEPKLSEGFDEIKKINFVFEGSDAQWQIWRQWRH
ncbi:hypothetical protein EC973_001101 [Apophysomyces ossiformis]|uniref:Uncharacterized protein n=1 Tax=Apophysomyces ossiformis TaxID=679940 RepID=A0A8H7BPT7_9FUNG|nr:hypothetical protein EC973_001101 [Apophysomyces ossiformis]